jgi:hypothetical protein
MEAACSSEMTVDFQETKWYISEDTALHNYRCENFKSYDYHVLYLIYMTVCQHELLQQFLLAHLCTCFIDAVMLTCNRSSTAVTISIHLKKPNWIWVYVSLGCIKGSQCSKQFSICQLIIPCWCEVAHDWVWCSRATTGHLINSCAWKGVLSNQYRVC